MTPTTADAIVKGLLQAIADAEIAGNRHLAQQYQDSLKHMLFQLGNNQDTDNLH